jgi:two-component system invasion response regulator UvrY
MPSVTTLREADARPVRVLTVDDQAPFRDAARAVVGATPGFESLAEAESGEDALALNARLHPDLVLVDVGLPGIDGVETSRRLTAADPRPVVVLLSADEYPLLRESPGACGAAAFITKQELRPRTLRALWERLGAITPAG